MPVPRKNPCPAMRSLIELGKITNQEGENPQGGGRKPHGAKRSAPPARWVGRRI
jgi:hypothetical protein